MSKQNITFFSLARQVKNLETQIKLAIDSVLQSQQFIGGNFVTQFEEKMAKHLGVKHVISCNSGTDALWIAVKALGTQPDSIVLTTPFSFIASSSEIAAHRAHPVFIDVDPKTLNICPNNLRNWLQKNAEIKNGKTVHKKTGQLIEGIVAVDIFGQCADYDPIKQIANEWNLWIIEDTAQSIGAEYKGLKAGTIGNVGCFSFYPTKNLGAYGDGGCCATNDSELAEKILRLRNHGRKSHYNYEELGINSRLDAMQAAVLNVKLDYIDQWNARRQEIAAMYEKGLYGINFIKIPKAILGKHVYHQYSIQIADTNGLITRDMVEKYLAENGVQTRIFYPQSLNRIPFLNTRKEIFEECPVSIKLESTILALPIWPEMENTEVQYVIETIKNMQTSLLNMPHANGQINAATR
ncbi:MAG: DegT/DnrJ/EryC1/StrS family aminotransferase [bacterium]